MKPFVVPFVAVFILSIRPASIQADTIVQYDVNRNRSQPGEERRG